MDREDYFNVLNHTSGYNFNTYITDRNWTTQSYFSHVSLKNESKTDTDDEDADADEQDNLQNFLTLDDIEDLQLSEKMNQQQYHRTIQTDHELACQANKRVRDYQERKRKLFENLLVSNSAARRRYNQLLFHYNPIAEKYSTTESFLESCPGLFPVKWPEGLDELISKLGSLDIEEIFYQPFDMNGDFHTTAGEFIRCQFDKFIEDPNNDTIKAMLIKSIQALMCIKIMDGDFTKLFQVLNSFEQCFNLNQGYFNQIFQSALSSNSNESQNMIITRLRNLVEIYKENNSDMYPIMRNYSVSDYFNISKNILFAPYSNNTQNCVSVTTDSSYLYLLLSGICGGLYKIGTGNGGTFRGKVYAQMNKNISFQNNHMIFGNKKLIVKTETGQDVREGFGGIFIYNSDTLQYECGKILKFKESAMNSSVRKINERFVILGDDQNLYSLVLEPEILRLPQRKEIAIATHLNLVLYTFPFAHIFADASPKHSMSLSTEKSLLVDELFNSFTRMFSKEQCLIALEKKKWNMEKSAKFLIKHQAQLPKIKQMEDIIKPSNIMRLFQTRVECTIDKKGNADYQMVENSPFDTSKFDTLKWAVVRDKVIGYSLEEGSCVIFSSDPSQEKEIKYSYTEKPARNIELSVLSDIDDESANLSEKESKKLLERKKKQRVEYAKATELKDYLKTRKEIPSSAERFALALPPDVKRFALEDFLKREDVKLRDEFLDKLYMSFVNCEEKKTNTNYPTEESNEPVDNVNESKKEKLLKRFFITDDKPRKTVEDTVKGTLIKFLPSITAVTLSGRIHGFCYDNLNKVYYLIRSSLITFSILISDTYEHKSDLLKKISQECTEMAIDDIQNYFENIHLQDFHYPTFYEHITALIIYLHTRKADINWKYTNWNYFYSSLLLRNQEDYTQCPQVLIPKLKINKDGIARLENHLNMSLDLNERIFRQQLPKELNEHFTIKLEKKSSSSSSSPLMKICPNTWEMWNNVSEFTFEGDYERYPNVYSSSNCIYLNNRRHFFNLIDGTGGSLTVILSLLSNSLKNHNDRQLASALILVYLWIENENHLPDLGRQMINAGIEELKQMLVQVMKMKNVRGIIQDLPYKIILAGWDSLCQDMKSQIEWLIELEKRYIASQVELTQNLEMNILRAGYEATSINPFAVLLQKLSINSSLVLLFNFNKIHSVFSYNIYPSEINKSSQQKLYAKPNGGYFLPNNWCFPFHFILIANVFQTLPEEKELNTGTAQSILSKFSLSPIHSENNLEYFIYLSNSFWGFLSTKIFDQGSESRIKNMFLSLLLDLFMLCMGDYYNFLNNATNNEQWQAFFSNCLVYVQRIIEHPTGFDSNLTQRFSFSVLNAVTSFYQNRPVMCWNILFPQFISFLNHIRRSPMLMEGDMSIIDHHIYCITTSGAKTDNQKIIEYKFGEENIQINECISFPGASLIAVEIEYNPANEKKIGMNDLIIVSKLHYQVESQLKYSNFYKDYGTSFRLQLTKNPVQMVFLIGDEIKIVSQKDSGGCDSNAYSHEVDQNIYKNIAGKSHGTLLKFIIYPVNEIGILSNRNMRRNITTDHLQKNWIEFVKDIDFFITQNITKLIKSVDTTMNEKSLEILNEPIFKLGIAESCFEESSFESLLGKMSLNNPEISEYITSMCKMKHTKKDIKHYESLLPLYPSEIKEEAETLLKEMTSFYANENHEVQFENFPKLIRILKEIRDHPSFQEPQSYTEVKRLPSFNKRTQQFWKLVELAFCLCLIYHLNLEKELLDPTAEISPFGRINLSIIGKRLNSVLSWMCGRLKAMKATYDSIRNYIQEISDMISNSKQFLKDLIIDGIKKNQKIPPVPRNAQIHKDFQTQKIQTESEKNIHSVTIPELQGKNLCELAKEYPSYYEKLDGLAQLSNISKEISEKIKNDLTEQYYGNPVSLKERCDANGLPFTESNLAESLKNYTQFILSSIAVYIPFDTIVPSTEVNITAILKKLYMNSPYVKIPAAMAERLLFLMKLNKIDTFEEPAAPVLLISKIPSVYSTKIPTSTLTKGKPKEDDCDKALTSNQVIFLRSICNFLADDTQLDEVERALITQRMRYHLRVFGIHQLGVYLRDVDNSERLSSVLCHLPGAISCSTKESLFSSVDTVPMKFPHNLDDIQSIVKCHMASFGYFLSNKYLLLGQTLELLNLITSDVNVLLKSFPNSLEIDIVQIEALIFKSLRFVFTHNAKSTPELNKMKTDFLNSICLLVTKLVNVKPSVANNVIDFCTNVFEAQVLSQSEQLVISLLEFMYHLAFYSTNTPQIPVIIDKCISLALNSYCQSVVCLIFNIIKVILRFSSCEATLKMDQVFDKLGRLLTFESEYAEEKIPDNDKYRVAVQINSQEFDYQFLVNALYHWEEKYPTELSLYKDIEQFMSYLGQESHSLETIPPEYNINHSITLKAQSSIANLESRIERHFNRLSKKTKKMAEMEAIVKSNIDGVLATMKIKEVSENEDLFCMKQMELAYYYRILHHIQLAELIGESACARGFIILETVFSRERADEFAEMVHKAENNMLPSIKQSLESNQPLFSEYVVFPMIPDISELVPGCTNVLKETTPNFINVTVINERIVQKVRALEKTATCNTTPTPLKLLWSVFDENCVSGCSISLIIDDIMNLISNIYSNEVHSLELLKLAKTELKKISNEKNYHLLGLLYFLSGGYPMLRPNSKVTINNNSSTPTCKIVQGGHKSGMTCSCVMLSKDKSLQFEQVKTSSLQKIENDSHQIFLNQISLEDLIEPFTFITSQGIFKKDNSEVYNRMILHLLLKLLKQKMMSSDEITKIDKRTFGEFIQNLKSLGDEIQWVPGSLTNCEVDFIEAYERIYDRLSLNSYLVYSPVCFSSFENSNYVKCNDEDNADLITKYVLPESAYLSQLPKISDVSKCQTAMKNVQNFDKIILDEIITKCSRHNEKDRLMYFINQVRSFLLFGNVREAMGDLLQFYGSESRKFIAYLREDYNMKEVIKEECLAGNYYLAKMPPAFVIESGIKSLQKYKKTGIEIPVLLLSNDNAMSMANVMYIDHEYGKMHSFMIPVIHLNFLENQLKLPASSFGLEYLKEEFKCIERHLSILYSKKAVLHILDTVQLAARGSYIPNFDELLYHISLSKWEKFKTDPESSVFKDFFNYILIKNISTEQDIALSRRTSSFKNLPTRAELIALAQRDDKTVSIITSLEEESNLDIEDALNEVIFTSEASQEIIAKLTDWCIDIWRTVYKRFMKFNVDLFNEYTTTIFNVRNKNMFHIGNFSNKLLALHELFNINTGNFSGMIITFQRDAFVGPQAKVSFYTDSYGENLASEMISIKREKGDLQAIVFNQPKIWMGYQPGTTIFHTFEWYLRSRDSFLPCCITFIPHDWPMLIYLTDLLTNAPFMTENFERKNLISKLNRELFNHCASLSLPEEIQRKIFSITNRTVLKASSNISRYRDINLHNIPIEEKFELVGVQPDQMIKLIENMSTVKEKLGEQTFFSSSYIVEGVEVVLSVITTIKESFTTLHKYLLHNYQYTLPLWIEAIIKLGQFLSFLQGNSELEDQLMEEINNHLSITSQFEKIIIVSNINCGITDDIIIGEIKNILAVNSAKVVDVEKDVQIFQNDEDKTKIVGILIDGFVIDKSYEGKEEGSLQMMKIDSYSSTVFEQMRMLKHEIQVSKILTESKNEKECESRVLNVVQACDFDKSSDSQVYSWINRFLQLRFTAYINEKFDLDNKIRAQSFIFQDIIQPECDMIMQLIAQPDMTSNCDMIQLYKELQSKGVDLWLEAVILDQKYRQKGIKINTMEKIREVVDLQICKEQSTCLIIPSNNLRFVPSSFKSINHSTTDLLTNEFAELRDIPIAYVRYYWTIIKYFNKCLITALPFIRPSDITSQKDSVSVTRDGYNCIYLPKTISAFLATARGITFSHVKNNLIREILSTSEFDEELIQIPTFHFERMQIASNLEKNLIKKGTAKRRQYAGIEEEELRQPQEKESIKTEESLFLQAFQQAKGVDPAFFRSKKIEGDHTGFKVEFKNELVQGISGPFRQFFSDILIELQDCSDQNKKSLRLLHPSSNKLANRGEFKDRFTITPSYNSPPAMDHYEFLGMLMGICFHTGVHLPLDLCSLVWKKIINEPISIEDIKEFDEGLYEQILSIESDREEFEKMYYNQAFTTLLTDGTQVDLIQDGANYLLNYDNRVKFILLTLKARLAEADPQIEMIRKGLCRMVPISLLQLLTCIETQRFVCGIKKIDINLLMANTQLKGDLTKDSNRVIWLWEILQDFSEEDKVKFIKFCWAQERLPPTQEEFNKRQVKFTIKPMDKRKDIPPKADTCFFFLILPDYSSKCIMRNMIHLAITWDNVGLNGDNPDRELERRGGR